MIRGILEIEGVPFLQRLLKCRLGARALTIEGGGNSRLAASGERRLGGCEAVLNLYVSRPRSNERGRSLRLDKRRGNGPRRCPPDSIPPSPEQPLLRWRQSEPSVPPHAALAFGQSAGSSCHARHTLTRFSGSSRRLS